MRYVVLALIVVATVGCDENLNELTGPTPNLEVSFASIQREIFSSTDSRGRVACITCHNAANAAATAGLILTEGAANAALVGVPSRTKPGAIRVIPGDPDNSYLVHKLEGAPGIVGLRMPGNGGPFLTEGQMLVIRRWIAEGAGNN